MKCNFNFFILFGIFCNICIIPKYVNKGLINTSGDAAKIFESLDATREFLHFTLLGND